VPIALAEHWLLWRVSHVVAQISKFLLNYRFQNIFMHLLKTREDRRFSFRYIFVLLDSGGFSPGRFVYNGEFQ